MMIQTPLLQELQNMSITFLRIQSFTRTPNCGKNGAFLFRFEASVSAHDILCVCSPLCERIAISKGECI